MFPRSLEGVAIFMIQTRFVATSNGLSSIARNPKIPIGSQTFRAVLVLDNQRRIEKYAKKSSSTVKINNICFTIT